MAFKWASSAIYRRDGLLLFLDLAAEQRIGSPLLLSFDCVRGDALGCRAVWNLRASRSIRTSNSTRTESRIPEKVTRSTCCWPSRSQGCRYVGSRRGVETAESATLAGCTAAVGPALSCRLIGIRREWPAYGKFETDVHILIVLASLRSELSPGLDYRTCQ